MEQTNYKYIKSPNYDVLDFWVDIFNYGLKVARDNAKIRKRIQRALLNAGIGFPVSNDEKGKIMLELPLISIIRHKENLEITIQNSIKFQDKLASIDISSAVNGYVVESFYISEDRTHYVYECEPIGIDYQLVFEKFVDLKEFVKECESSKGIPIDKRLNIPYSHILITGMTGSGKTTAIFYLLLFLEIKFGKSSVYVIDPKEESLCIFGKARGYNTAVKNSQILPLFRRFVELMGKRKANVRKAVKRSKKFDSDALKFGYAPRFIFIDELAALNAIFDKKEQAEFYSLLSQVILLGRSLGFYVVLSLQQNNAKELTTALKEQIGFKVALGNSGKQTYLTLFDDLEGAQGLLKQKKKIGEGLYFNSLIGQMSVKKLRFPHLKFLGG